MFTSCILFHNPSLYSDVQLMDVRHFTKTCSFQTHQSPLCAQRGSKLPNDPGAALAGTQGSGQVCWIFLCVPLPCKGHGNWCFYFFHALKPVLKIHVRHHSYWLVIFCQRELGMICISFFPRVGHESICTKETWSLLWVRWFYRLVT